MTLGKIIDRLMVEYNAAVKVDAIRKPWAYSLYQVWKWVDRNEEVNNG